MTGATTALVVHLDVLQAALLIADRSVVAEVFDMDDPHGMPVGTLLVTLDPA